MSAALEQWIEEEVERLGYEVVELERAGSKNRPIFRLRIDRPDSTRGDGVTVDDCTRVSRALEQSLDERGDLSSRYVLEVSSPGIERPLVRPRDFERFAGEEIAVVGRSPIHGKSKRVEGELVGLRGEGDGEQIVVRTSKGEEVEIPRRAATKVHLVYRWDDGNRK